MHFVKEYISKYNNTKENIKLRINDIERDLDLLCGIKGVKDIEELEYFYENIFSKKYVIIELNIKFIIDYLDEIQKFCYEDINKVIPHLKSLEELPKQEAFKKAKNIDWLIETIKSEEQLTRNEKRNLLDISEFNKKIRYFVHSTLAFTENPLPIVAKTKLLENNKEKKFIYSPENLYDDICYCLAECLRIRRAVEQFYILTNVDYGDWNSINTDVEDLVNYLSIYKHRFLGYYYGEKNYHIDVAIDNRVNEKLILYIPIVKVKEVIDVLMHNAAEELILKELEALKIFDKKINCVLENDENFIILKIIDNGRGVKNDEVNTPFFSSKNTIKNNGIGLDIANKNTTILKGKIESVNNEDEGATFIFTFPIRNEIEQDGFKKKIIILILGENSKFTDIVKDLNKRFEDTKIIRTPTISTLIETLSKNELEFINIIVKEKNKYKSNNFLYNEFKGELIEV
jgi:hypothetical protein